MHTTCRFIEVRGTTPFDLVLTRHPPSLLMEEDVRDHFPRTILPTQAERISSAKKEFLERFEKLMQKARANLSCTQARYKRNFDARIRSKLRSLEQGGFVYREIEKHPPGVNPKLVSPVNGPFEVKANEWTVIVLNDRGREIRVNTNRLVRAPTPKRRGDPRSWDGRRVSDSLSTPRMGAGRSLLEEGEGNVFPEDHRSHGSDATAFRGLEGSAVLQSLEELEIARLSRNRHPQEEDEAAIQLGLLPSHDWDDLETAIRETEASRHPLEDSVARRKRVTCCNRSSRQFALALRHSCKA